MDLWVRKSSAGWFTSDAQGELGPEVTLLHDFITCRFGPLVLLGFSLPTQHLVLQDFSEWCRLIARWSWSRWATYTVIGFPQSIEFKPPRQKHQVFFWLSFRNPITSLCHTLLSSRSLKLAQIQGERNYLSVGRVAKNLLLFLIHDTVLYIDGEVYSSPFSGNTSNWGKGASFTHSQFSASPGLSYETYQSQ